MKKITVKQVPILTILLALSVLAVNAYFFIINGNVTKVVNEWERFRTVGFVNYVAISNDAVGNLMDGLGIVDFDEVNSKLIAGGYEPLSIIYDGDAESSNAGSLAGVGVAGAGEGLDSESGAGAGDGSGSESGAGAGEGAVGESGTGAVDGTGSESGIEAEDGSGSEEGKSDSEHRIPAGIDEDAEKPFITVEDSYFADALFIGDSRVAGMKLYGGIEGAAFFSENGLTTRSLLTRRIADVDGVRMTVEEALEIREFKKIYIEVGINEMGGGDVDTFIDFYSAAIERIKELQPNSVIFICSILSVSKKKSDSSKYFTLENIAARNARLAELADRKTVFYVDINKYITDEDGALTAGITFDEVHLFAKYYYLIFDALRECGVGVSNNEDLGGTGFGGGSSFSGDSAFGGFGG